jgi:hypothetical protein
LGLVIELPGALPLLSTLDSVGHLLLLGLMMTRVRRRKKKATCVSVVNTKDQR